MQLCFAPPPYQPRTSTEEVEEEPVPPYQSHPPPHQPRTSTEEEEEEPVPPYQQHPQFHQSQTSYQVDLDPLLESIRTAVSSGRVALMSDEEKDRWIEEEIRRCTLNST